MNIFKDYVVVYEYLNPGRTLHILGCVEKFLWRLMDIPGGAWAQRWEAIHPEQIDRFNGVVVRARSGVEALKLFVSNKKACEVCLKRLPVKDGMFDDWENEENACQHCRDTKFAAKDAAL